MNVTINTQDQNHKNLKMEEKTSEMGITNQRMAMLDIQAKEDIITI